MCILSSIRNTWLATVQISKMPDFKIDSSIQMPLSPRPIISIGAGGIVREAHQPAYQNAAWPVIAVYDPIPEKANQLARDFSIPAVCTSLEEAVAIAPLNAVFDIAVPASEIINVLPLLPDNSIVMIQKPLGSNIEEATVLRNICKQKKFTAAMNFQKRFIPSIVAAKRLIDNGTIGELHHIEIRMNIYTPWPIWEFLFGIPRMEMLYHSIHYMDLMRYFLGNPTSVYAKTVKHPQMMQLASVRSVIILNYGDTIQAYINTNHGNKYGMKHQNAFIQWEGTKGAIRHQLGKNINFPEGVADSFEISLLEEGIEAEWQSYPIEGVWYPDAFIGSMANLMCYAEGSEKILINSIDSAYQTMQLLEAAYKSNEQGGMLVEW